MKPYIQENKQRFLDELFDLLRIPSVSADSKHTGDVRRAAQFVQQKLIDAGVDRAELHETAGHPIVFAELLVDEKLPTILVYGHYDVQPADPIDLWKTPPFEPEIRDEKIYARGASDDKGQMFMHVKALETMLAKNELHCNMKFIIEGEEEVGSDNLDEFVKANQTLLKSDVVLISDTGIISNEHPSITVGLRGLSYVEVEVTGPNRDLHSGMYGGGVANPINILCEMIASLHDENEQVAVDGFYDAVAELSKSEREEMAKAPYSESQLMKDLDIAEVHGEKGYTTLERLSIRPTLDVNGIWGGYTGEGAKTVIASKAYAKISMRLVPNQSSEKITQLFQQHFEKIAPKSVKVKVSPHHGGEPAVNPTDSISYQAANQAFIDTWGKKPIPMREGGSIPIVALFENELKVNVLLMGFGLDEDAIHSPNESYGVFNYLKGIETITSFNKHYAKLMK